MIPHLHRRWTADDLDALIKDKVSESRFLDYKRDLPSNKESDIKDFLVDVSAFANSSGGTILFGIEEDEGEPKTCPGIGNVDIDEEKRRLSSILENSLDPPLRVDFKAIETREGKRVLVLKIKQSSSAPHMITRGSRKFYSRGVAGNVPMGSYEIRSAFLASEGMSEKVRNFVEQRCRRILAREIDFDLNGRAHAVFHIIPIEAFSRPRNLSMAELETVKEQFVPAVSPGGRAHRYCLEGIAATSWTSETRIFSYSLMFRNGCVEATCPCRNGDTFNEGRVAGTFIKAAPTYEKILGTLGFPGPFFVSLTILGCKDTIVQFDPAVSEFLLDVRPINTDFLSLPILEWLEDPVDWSEVLRHFCDLCSNAMGFPSSLWFRKG